MIAIPGNVRVWLATGHTDMRRGFPSLARLVQEDLNRDPHLCIGRDYVAEAPDARPGRAARHFIRHIRSDAGEQLQDGVGRPEARAAVG